MFDKKVFELPLSRDYVRHWGLSEAVRELLQNALDSDSPFEYQFLGDSLFISSRMARLEPYSLLLGNTSKADSPETIGSFGEGYKIALLVLTRLGHPCIVHNNEYTWTPEFRHSKQFGSDVLCVVQEKAPVRREGLTFEIGGINEEAQGMITASCLQMQPSLLRHKSVHQGEILWDHPSQLFVGGLYICDTELEYGYNVRPEFIRLERDRKTVDEFDLKLLTREMWFATKEYDQIAELIEQDIPDLNYASFGAPEMVKEACFRRFQAQNPGAVVAKNQKELDALVDRGLTNVVVVNERFHACVSGSSSYVAGQGQLARVPTPEEALTAYFEKNRGLMRRIAIVDFKALIKLASNWRNK